MNIQVEQAIRLCRAQHRMYPAGLLCLVSLFWLTSCKPPASQVAEESPSQTTNEPETKIEQTIEPSTNPGNALPPPPPTNAYLAQLPPEVTNQLVELGIDIAIPTYLPANMTLANYGIGEKLEGVGGGPYYWLVYRDNQDRCFAIEYTSSGIGGISLENQEPLEIPLFGDNYSLYHGKFPNGGNAELPDADLFTDWIEGNDGFYRLLGAGLINAQDYGQGDCQNLPVKDAITITESLIYLPTDIRTLGIITPESAPVDNVEIESNE